VILRILFFFGRKANVGNDRIGKVWKLCGERNGVLGRRSAVIGLLRVRRFVTFPDGNRKFGIQTTGHRKRYRLTQRKSAIEQNLLAAKAVAQDTPRTAQQETQIASLEAERAAIDSEISKTQIVAPFECVVAELLATQGGLTEGRKAAIKIVEVARPNVEIDLPRRIAQWINSQQSYSFLINGSVKQGTLLRRSVTENPVGNSTFWFELQQAEGMDALFGSTVECRFNLRTDATGFWVPLSALSHRGKGIWSVMVLAEGQGDSAVGLNEVQRRLVEVKQVEEQRALIDGGVASGDLVIAAGLHRVVAGQKVKMNLIQARTTVASKPGSEP